MPSTFPSPLQHRPPAKERGATSCTHTGAQTYSGVLRLLPKYTHEEAYSRENCVPQENKFQPRRYPNSGWYRRRRRNSTSTRISARMKCGQGHSSPVNILLRGAPGVVPRRPRTRLWVVGGVVHPLPELVEVLPRLCEARSRKPAILSTILNAVSSRVNCVPEHVSV